MLDNGSDGDQSDDKDPNVKNILDQLSIAGIPEGEPSVIKDDPSNIDEDMTGTHHSKINQDDLNLLSSLLDILKDDRKRHLDADQENKVIKSSEDRFQKAQCSHILSKILKRT